MVMAPAARRTRSRDRIRPRQLAHSGVCDFPPARSRSTASHTRCARSIKAKGLETVQEQRMALRREPRRQETTEFGCVVERQHASAVGHPDRDERRRESYRLRGVGKGLFDAGTVRVACSSSTVVLRFRGRGPFRNQIPREPTLEDCRTSVLDLKRQVHLRLSLYLCGAGRPLA